MTQATVARPKLSAGRWSLLLLAALSLALGAAPLLAQPGAARKSAPEARHQEGESETVMFNTQTLKYHCPQCKWAVRCTKNCVRMSVEKARELGGVPCTVCGGTCRSSRR